MTEPKYAKIDRVKSNGLSFSPHTHTHTYRYYFNLMLISDPVNYCNLALTKGQLTMKIPSTSNGALELQLWPSWIHNMMDLFVSSVKISGDLYKHFSTCVLKVKSLTWYWEFLYSFVGRGEGAPRAQGGLAKHFKICYNHRNYVCLLDERWNCNRLHWFLYFLRELTSPF